MRAQISRAELQTIVERLVAAKDKAEREAEAQSQRERALYCEGQAMAWKQAAGWLQEVIANPSMPRSDAEHFRSVPCPKCGAPAGRPCKANNTWNPSQPYDTSIAHRARRRAAGQVRS